MMTTATGNTSVRQIKNTDKQRGFGRVGKKPKVVMSAVLALIFMAGFFVIQVLPAQAAVNPSLIGYWNFDDGSGTTATDNSGNGNDGTLGGSPTWSTELPSALTSAGYIKDSHSLSFDGSSSHVDFGDVLDVGTGDLTISAWFNTSDSTSNQLLISKLDGVNGSYRVGIYSGGLYVLLKNGSTTRAVTMGSGYADGAWHNATVTFDRSGNATGYIDGTQVGALDISSVTGSIDGTATLTFGADSGGHANFFNGSLDDVRMYNVVLTAGQVANLAAGHHTGGVDTWTGALNGQWSNAANWSAGVPGITSDVVIPASKGDVDLSAAASVGSLSIATGSSLHLEGNNLTFSPGGVFSNYGTLYMQGDETLTNFTNDTDSGAVMYDGSGTYASLPAGNDYNSLWFRDGTWTIPDSTTLNASGSIYTLSAATVNAGNSTITVGYRLSNAGTINAGSSTINVNDTWNNTGTFNAGTSTVMITGTFGGSAINDSTTFYNLSTNGNGGWIDFAAGETQTVTHNLTLSGYSGGLLSLASSSPGTQWKIDPQGTVNLSYLKVYFGDNISTSNNPLLPTISLDGGGNAGWDFAAPSVSTLGPSGYTDGSWSADNTPTLSFTTADSDTSADVKYQIQIDNNSDFGSPEVDTTSSLGTPGSTSFTPSAALSDGSYYWRVKAIDEGDLESSWSTANSGSVAFKVDTTPPSVPGKPTTTSPNSNDRPVWSWTASTDAGVGLDASSPYIFEWSTESDFSIITGTGDYDQSTGVNQPVPGLADGTWYFRVKTQDVEGNASAWSPIGSVIIDTADPNTPAASVGGGAYTSAQTVTITASDNTGGSGLDGIYYTTNGDTPTTSSTKISSGDTISVSSSEPIKAIAVDKAGNASGVLAEVYTIDSQDPNQPTADPSGGTYGSSQQVELTAADNGDAGIDAIYYTTNGDTPTSSSTEYTGKITVNKSETVKAIAYDKAGNASPVMSEEYTIARTDTWQGPASGSWDTPANWSDGIVPDIDTAVIIGSGGTSPVLDVDASVASLTIKTPYSLDLNGHNLTFASGGTFSNEGTLMLNGDETLTNFTNDTDSGDVSYMGSDTYTGLAAGNEYYDLDFSSRDGHYTGVWNLNSDLTVHAYLQNHGDTFNTNNYAVSSVFVTNYGTLNAGSSTITLNGSIPNFITGWGNSGTFNAGTSTVKFTGTNQAITGSNTFYNLTKIASGGADTLTFEAGETQTIIGSVILNGSPSGNLSLVSTTPGVQWKFYPYGAGSLQYLTVTDSDNINNGIIGADHSIDGGNNTNWDLTAPNMPVASPAGGTYSSDQFVSLTATDNPGGVGIDAIYYTTDSSTPSKSNTKYTGAISVSKSETIKAIAYDKLGYASPLMTETYTISKPTTGGGKTDKSDTSNQNDTKKNNKQTSSQEDSPSDKQSNNSTSQDKSNSSKSAEPTVNFENSGRQQSDKSLNTKNTSAWLGLGWWWLLVVAALVGVWWILFGARRRRRAQN